ncbi:hypothetical protein HKW98_08675 [Stutzerimonas urumqiensis]|uniref:hypothetical protein n=1 Tax=Stutzerimonas urumqiensis TaxID=638269 RepID=UPI003BA9FD77
MDIPQINHHDALDGVMDSYNQLHVVAESSTLTAVGLFQGQKPRLTEKAGAGQMEVAFPPDTGILAYI